MVEGKVKSKLGFRPGCATEPFHTCKDIDFSEPSSGHCIAAISFLISRAEERIALYGGRRPAPIAIYNSIAKLVACERQVVLII